MTAAPLLAVENLDVHYHDFRALRGVSMAVHAGETVAIIGANGAGKSTLLNTLAGLSLPSRGDVVFAQQRIASLPAHQRVALGISLVPEGRRIFRSMSVRENLLMGAYPARVRPRANVLIQMVGDIFPNLRSRFRQTAGTLSGGEQQMLAIARAMMSAPRLLMCDEISLGLSPAAVKEIYRRLADIKQAGTTLLLVEQDIGRSLAAADRAYVMLQGRVVLEGTPETLSAEDIRRAYFGL